MGINLMSDVFEKEDVIPTRHTCDDITISPSPASMEFVTRAHQEFRYFM